MAIDLHIRLRGHQLAALKASTRFCVLVWHRRAGKTFYTLSRLLIDALRTARTDWRGYYVAPTFKQAKRVSWDYLKAFVKAIPGVSINEAELRVDFPNGSRIQLLGAEQYDSLRGQYADALVLDETALIPSTAWTSVLMPMLADRKGWAIFIGTPMGRINLFFTLWEYAGSGDDPEWSRSLLTCHDTDALDASEIKRMQAAMREEEFAQELLCSWNAAIRGAYYAKEMAEAEAAGRVTTVKHDKSLPVYAAVDLGWSDAMVTTFWQIAGTEHRAILARAWEYTSIPDMVADWKGLGFPVDTAILPHDAKVHELGSGKTRREVFHGLGCKTVLAPSQGLHEGIAQTRLLLPHVWWDLEDTRILREAMVAYRSEYDEVKQIHRTTPIHDWSSHWADSVRYYATGKPGNHNWGPKPSPKLGIVA